MTKKHPLARVSYMRLEWVAALNQRRSGLLPNDDWDATLIVRYSFVKIKSNVGEELWPNTIDAIPNPPELFSFERQEMET
jgi:hypothetical protein